jgi:cytochrome oxidase Cu insertion factor (SCO1/SenC/PrrC family)
MILRRKGGTMLAHVPTVLAALLLAPLAAQQDGFPREGKRTNKDPLEGKAPPALSVGEWLNTDGKPITWEALRGKVVLIDFWGVW